MKNKKKIFLIITAVLIILVLILLIGNSFGFFKYLKKGDIVNIISIGGIDVDIIDENTSALSLESAYPISDEEGLELTPFEFEITNTSKEKLSYSITVETDTEKLSTCKLEDESNCQELSTKYIKYAFKKNDGTYSQPAVLFDSNNIITNDVFNSNDSNTYSLLIWIDKDAGNEIMNKYFFGKLIITGAKNQSLNYEEILLNGADPVLKDGLVPVVITDNGTVKKADITKEWYSYGKKNWANAVILKDESTYDNNQVIPESNIESYFVWIPKYSYQLWDLGNYSSLTSISSKEQEIKIKFGLTNTSDTNSNECTTPKVAGESGNCSVGDYMTHPAFLAFNTNGLWVGKFETGYDGATSTAGAQQNSVDTSKIIIKPNVYSWRNLTVGNMFKNSYDYNRNLDSHMMKNTEWGAVAYLQHSKYGSQTSVRINNNSSYITGYAAVEEPTLGYNNGTSIVGNRNESTSLGVDGTYTISYLNTNSTTVSTTGNKSGIYDMSGGAWELIMGYTTGATTVGGTSGITSLYSDFFTNSSWNKYYDKYSSTVNTNYNNRILGDAIGEMGPFGSQIDADGNEQYKSSWYEDYAYFVNSARPWFYRGGRFDNGIDAGIFACSYGGGGAFDYFSFRIVLAPTE